MKYVKFGWLTKLWIRITTLKPKPSLTQPQRRKRILQDEYKTFRNRNQTNTAARSLLVNDVPHSFWGEPFSYKPLTKYLLNFYNIILSVQTRLQSRWYLLKLYIFCSIIYRTCRIQHDPYEFEFLNSFNFPEICNFQWSFCPCNDYLTLINANC